MVASAVQGVQIIYGLRISNAIPELLRHSYVIFPVSNVFINRKLWPEEVLFNLFLIGVFLQALFNERIMYRACGQMRVHSNMLEVVQRAMKQAA